MKRIFVLLLIGLLAFGVDVEASSRKERAPKSGDAGWTITQLDGDKLVWYSFRGEEFGAQQFVNVVSLDLNCKDYELEFVAIDRLDSLSSVAMRHDAVVAINGTYEWDASFVKVDGKVFSEITLPADHLRYWKHEGAVAYDGKKIEIGYGDKSSYAKSKMPNMLSSSPML
ncbi:MAG: hypothetical protein IIW60_06845, partial [Alistipes sp.]|nr:hypothetical protein [Alistipes sp.]